MNEIQELEGRLMVANERLSRALAALAPKHLGGEYEEYHAAHREVMILERQHAAALGQEFAEPCDFPLRWECGAPMPQLMVNDHRALLAFLISTPDPNWDGSYVTIKNASDAQPQPLGLVEFEYCVSAKLGDPNDEVLEGHPLYGKGLEAYAAQRVVNSQWIQQIEAMNRVHRMYRSDSWRDLNHYIFGFHDSTFECIARSCTVDTYQISMRELLGLMADRLIGRTQN